MTQRYSDTVERLAFRAQSYVIHIDGADRNLGSVIRAQAKEIDRLLELIAELKAGKVGGFQSE